MNTNLQHIWVRNKKLVHITQFLSALIFTIPIWIVYYQGKITPSQISFFIAMQYVIQIVLELPTGAIADIIGRRYTVLFGYIAAAISSIVLVSTADFTTIFIATVFAGLSEALISGSLEALLFDSAKEVGQEKEFAKVMADTGFTFQIGLVIAAFSGGFLYQIWTGLPFLLCGVANVFASIVSFYYIEPVIDSEKFTLGNYARQIKTGFREIFKTRDVAIMSLFYILVGGITWTNQMYLKSYMLVELGFNDITRSMIDGSLRLLNIFVLKSLLKNNHIFTPRRSILFFPIIMLVSFLPGIFYSSYFAIPLLMGALMAGTARWIILVPFTNELYDSRYRATAISALSMIIGVIFILITGVAGTVIENYGGVRMMYTLLGVLTLIFIVPLTPLVLKLPVILKSNK